MTVDVVVDAQVSQNEFADVTLWRRADRTVPLTRLDVEYGAIWALCGPVPAVNADLLLVASVVYALDKLVVRDTAADAWTRTFDVRIPVAEFDRWKAARETLESCVSYLTGDSWRFRFARRAGGLARPRPAHLQQRGGLGEVEAICLFSGGLDSLIGAIDWMEANRGRLLLVGHHDGDVAGPLSDQRGLMAPLATAYPGRFTAILPRIGIRPGGPEISFRSRSLLFLGLAMHVAGAAPRGTPVLIPENGNIALNVPLTPSRQGSCSTRTAHPHYLELLVETLARLGLNTPILNPLRDKSKGECVLSCKNPKLLRTLYDESASCAKRGHKVTWIRRDARQCGRCMPCLYRRAALHAAGWDDERYGVDICAGELLLDTGAGSAVPEGSEDTLAMLAFLRSRLTPSAIARRLSANGRIAPGDLPRATALVERAMNEVRALLADKAVPPVRRLAGLDGRRSVN